MPTGFSGAASDIYPQHPVTSVQVLDCLLWRPDQTQALFPAHADLGFPEIPRYDVCAPIFQFEVSKPNMSRVDLISVELGEWKVKRRAFTRIQYRDDGTYSPQGGLISLGIGGRKAERHVDYWSGATVCDPKFNISVSPISEPSDYLSRLGRLQFLSIVSKDGEAQEERSCRSGARDPISQAADFHTPRVAARSDPERYH